MTHALDPRHEQLRQRIARRSRPYTIKDYAGGLYGLAIDPGELAFDDSAMAVTGIISTEAEDRSKDVIYALGAFGGRGLWTENHEKNPVVFYEHAQLQAVKYPCVGLAETPAGVYTVKKFPGFVIGTTYFRQDAPEGPECYRLVRTGLMRGLSLGFKPNFEFCRDGPVYGYDERGNPQCGTHVGEGELVEYTHCWLPDNAECLTILQETLSRHDAGIEKLSPLMHKSLSAHAPAKKVWANGATLSADLKTLLVKSMAPDDLKTKRDPLTEGGYVEMDDTTDGTKHTPMNEDEAGEAPEVNEMPPGHHALADLHDKAMEMKDLCASHMQKQENPKVKAHLEKHMELSEHMCGETADLHKKEYQDNPGFEELGSESPEDEEAPPPGEGYRDDETGAEMGEEAYQKKHLELYHKKQLAARERTQKRLQQAEQRREQRYYKKFLKSQVAKKLDSDTQAQLQKAAESLELYTKIPADFFSDAAKGKENHDTFLKACSFQAKTLKGLATKAAVSAPEVEETKKLKAELEGLKKKHLEVMEENKKFRETLPQVERDMRRLKAKLAAATVGGPV